MSYKKSIIFLAAAFVLQPLIVSVVSVPGYPNLTLCFVVVCTMIYRNEESIPAIVTGLFFAFLTDCISGLYLGEGILSLVVTILYIFIVKRMVNVENPVISGVVFLGGTVVYNLTMWLLDTIGGSAYGILYVIKSLPPYLIANLVVEMIIYFILINKVINNRRNGYFR